MMDSPNLSFPANANTKNFFFCGVVEGFYGRPWTTEQRKDLFQKMETWGMDAYVYAPKDDYKHRAYWRDLYTVEEAEHLGSLVAAARARNLTFYYALSPGLDITYSNPKEVSTLKRKLDQVASLGCRAFALLFDDIDTEMSEADRERFITFAHAQVTLTNDVVEHLGERASGGFLVCPTQYCSTRAVPSVSQSEYLRTLGTQLSQEVDVMWTGPKVISRVIDMEGVEQVTEVLKRKVVIWDNLHANDYDQKRLFLGPYSGRSPALIPKLRGVLTNPNCEYGANFIAIHTLAQWSKCTSEHDIITLPSESSAVSADILLEQTSDGCDAAVMDDGNCADGTEPDNCTTSDLCYHPRTALRRAIIEWLPEFSRPKATQGGGIGTAKPQPPQLQLQSPQIISGLPVSPSSIDPVVMADAAAIMAAPVLPVNVATIRSVQVQVPGIVSSVITPGIGIIPNVNTCMGAPMAPLTITTTVNCAVASSVCESTVTVANTATSLGITGMLTPIANASDIVTYQQRGLHITCPDGTADELTIADVELMCELFYLPFEHGTRGLQLLQDFQWLKSHALQLEEPSGTSTPSPDAEEWQKKAAKMETAADTVARLMRRLTLCPNRELLYDLYAYVWEMRLVIGLLVSYVKWLARGRFSSAMSSFTQGSYTWFSKGWKETFMSGEQEPWEFRGGLTADLQRLIPVDSGNDLFVYRAPDVPTTCVYAVRPYIPPECQPQSLESEPESKHKSDYEAMYSVCLHTCADMHPYTDFMEETDVSGTIQHYGPRFLGDVTVGAYLQLHPELAMVIENDQGMVGYACAALDYKKFLTKITQPDGWSDEMKRKYPKAIVGTSAEGILSQQLLDNVHQYCDPESEDGGVYTLTSTLYPACITSAVLPRAFDDTSVSKRLVTCLLAALRANGVFGAHVLVRKSDSRRFLYYYRLGFQKLPENVPGRNVLGRTF